jgi:hypothetical protein
MIDSFLDGRHDAAFKDLNGGSGHWFRAQRDAMAREVSPAPGVAELQCGCANAQG